MKKEKEPKVRKFVLGDTEDQKELMKAVRVEEPVFRVTRNCEIRVRNHLNELRKLSDELDASRKDIRFINTHPETTLTGQVRQLVELEKLGIHIKNLEKWKRHLKADIKFLNNQQSLLRDEEDGRT